MFFWVTVYCHARDWPCLQNYIFQHFAWKVPALVYLVDGPLREKKEGEQSFQFINCKVSELVEIQMSYQVILVQVFSAVYPKHVVCTFTTIVFYELWMSEMNYVPPSHRVHKQKSFCWAFYSNDKKLRWHWGNLH